jgi:hypothetical protein
MAHLVVLVADASQKHVYRVTASVASFITTMLLCPLLYMEHMRSIRPADLAIAFLLVSLICDMVTVLQDGLQTKLLPATKIALKLILVVTESQSKQSLLVAPYDSQAPEQLAGILNRTFFWWINPLLALGYRIMLSADTLPPIDHQLSSIHLRHRGLLAWNQRRRPTTMTTLPFSLAKSMLPQFIAPVIPRLCLILFRYAQPVLISSAVRMLSGQSSGNRHMLILEAATVYLGLAVSLNSFHMRYY